MADTNYLYYGDQQVDQQALMNKMANGVVQYVQSQPWTRKRKDMFMSAYSDIMNNGLKGMSNNTGQWMVDFGGPTINWDSKSRKEKEMYEEAGYFIQQQMSGLATKPKEEEKEEEDKKELTKFKNEDFISSITNRLVNDWFGGNATNYSNQWNDYDKRGENGLRGINQRAGMLATSLRRYLNSLKDDQYDFADSPFTDINDFKTKIQTAINTLESDNKDLNQIKESLNVIGLDANEWFNNGSGDDYVDENGLVHINEATQKPYTYGQWYNYQNQLNSQKQETEQKAAEEKQKALDALQIYTSKPHQKIYTFEDLANKYGNTNDFLQSFKNKRVQDLNQEESDELTSFFYTLNSTDKGKQNLQDLTDEEWEPLKSKLQPLQSQYGYGTIERSKNQFKKVKGLDGIYYDTVQNTLVQVNQQGQEPLENLFSGLSDKEKKDVEQQRLIFEGSGLSGADITDIAASIVDLAGIGATFAPVVGNVAGAATGAVGSLTHFGADIARDGLDWGDAGKLGMNLAFDAATLIPGLGTAAKAGKLAKALAPWGPRLIAAFAAYQGLSNGSAITNSFKKLFSDYKSVTVDDLQNMAQGIALLAGGVNASRGIYQNRQAKKSLKPGTSSEPATIKTRNGRTLELNESEYNTLNSKTATREAKQAAIESAATRSGTPLDATDGISYKGWSIKNPTRTKNTSTEVEGLTAPKTAVQGVNIGEIRERNRKWIEEHPTLSRILPGRTTDSKVNWTNEGMYIKGVKENNTAQQSTQVETPARTPKPSTNTSNLEYFPKDANIKDVKEVQNALNAPDYKLKRETRIPQQNQNITGKLADGTSYEISFDGTNITVKGPKDLPELKGKSLHEQKQELGKWINKLNLERKPQLKKDSKEWKEFVNSIKELKRKGFLFKQGGKITDTQIDNFLKQYIKYENNSQRYS